MKKHNFNAGPSILPREVIEKTAQAVLDFNGSGLSIMEISHRAKDFQPVVDEAVALFKELLNIPEGYSVLFLGGGASLEFCMIPFNFLEKKAAYLNTGVWAKKAMKEAKAFGEVVEVASSAEATYTYIPKDYTVPADADYFHVTTNNTIYGTELHEDLDSPVPMIADMSSDIFSRPIDVSKYICIYGGAQKNLAPAGVTFVIVKNDAVGKVSRYIPTMLNYQTHIDGGSMFNTPPVLPIYAALQTLRWIKANGGVAEMQKRAKEKADMLYAEIDRNKMFRGTVTDKADRSYMNICFVMNDEYKELEADFMKFATERGMVGIKGHRSVGGFRASCYNAMPKESVQALKADFMKFATERGMVGIKGHRSVGGFRASCYNAMPKESVQALIDCMQEFEKLH
ncbi:phosphoserine aminotransferase [Phocaeicola dorei CAG:222]|nr:phosphoserine aminotransferase [Phocaeicola dorei CAG:222]